MNDTLELSKSGIPIQIIDWQKAISLCYVLETAYPLAEYSDRVIHTPNREFIVPSVIQLINSDHQPKNYTKFLPFNRKNVYIRDKGRCAYCNCNVSLYNFTFDHIVPQCLGGDTNWNNVVVSCMKCNGKKGSKPLNKSGMSLIREPYQPTLDRAAPASIVSKIGINIPEVSWEDYIYWNVILKD